MANKDTVLTEIDTFSGKVTNSNMTAPESMDTDVWGNAYGGMPISEAIAKFVSGDHPIPEKVAAIGFEIMQDGLLIHESRMSNK